MHTQITHDRLAITIVFSEDDLPLRVEADAKGCVVRHIDAKLFIPSGRLSRQRGLAFDRAKAPGITFADILISPQDSP